MNTILRIICKHRFKVRQTAITLGLLLASHAASADDTQLSAVSVNRGKALRTHVGVIVKESPQLVLNDLVTGKQLTFEKSEIRQIRRDIGKDGAARAIGVAPLVAWKLVDVLPEETKSGKIASVDGRAVYVTYGKKSGIKSGDKLNVYRIGKVIRDPDTGDVLGQERRKVGSLLISEVNEKYSKALYATDLEIEFKPGDLVTPESTKNAIAIFPLVDQRSLITKGGVQIAEELTSSLVNRGVSVVERIRLRDALKELKLQQSEDFNEKTVQKVGDLLGAFAIVTGSITNDRTRSKVNIKVIETATGKVLYAETFEVGKLNAAPATLFSPTSQSPHVPGRTPTSKATAKIPHGALRRFVGHTNQIRSLAFSPDGNYAVSCGVDRTVRLWEVATGKEVRRFNGHRGTINTVAFSPDGRFILSGSYDWSLRLWKVSTGEEVWAVEGGKDIRSVAFTPDGKSAVSGSRDGVIRLWDAKRGKVLRQFQSKSAIWSVAVAPNKAFIVSGNISGDVEMWNLKTGVSRKLARHSDIVKQVQVSPDNRIVLSASHDKTMCLWNLAKGSGHFLKGHSRFVSSAVFFQEGHFILSGSPDTTIRMWDAHTGEEIRMTKKKALIVSSVAVSRDSQFVIAGGGPIIRMGKGSGDHSIYLWHMRQFFPKSVPSSVAKP